MSTTQSHTLGAPMSLSAADITALLATGGAKGEYMRQIKEFDKSEELFVNFMELPQFANKVVASVYNSVGLNIKQYEEKNPDKVGRLVCKKDDDNGAVILINTAVHAALLAASAE